MLSTTTAFATGLCPRPRCLVIRASGNGTVAEGSKVKVVKELKVFHVPKHTEGLELNGMEGVVKTNVTQYKGKELSANLPWRVQFQVEKDGAAVKFFAHLDDDEIAAV